MTYEQNNSHNLQQQFNYIGKNCTEINESHSDVNQDDSLISTDQDEFSVKLEQSKTLPVKTVCTE